MVSPSAVRVAWLFPSLRKGNYWHPIFRDFTRQFPHTRIYTGLWPGFSPGLEGSFQVEVVGKTEFGDYGSRYTYASPAIVGQLQRFRPQVVFASGFSIWTLLALLLKPLYGWRVVILMDGSSPSIDFLNSRLRLLARRLMARFTDGFCANSRAAQTYLIRTLRVSPDRIDCAPYLVPDRAAMLATADRPSPSQTPDQPTFLFVGELIERKGLPALLEACALLQRQGYTRYRVLIVGDGPQRQAWEALAQQQGIADRLQWLGWVEYGQLGLYFQQADGFIFPTLEDVWGMVLLEAMLFGQPVLCSCWAGAQELVVDGRNGYRFDPHQPEQLARLMAYWIDHPETMTAMGQQALQSIAPLTPAAAVQGFAQMVGRWFGPSLLPQAVPQTDLEQPLSLK